ncbi:MAG: hypothetical protein A3J47_01300 [Candidatus Yanofskybacteria bacterium RIFCSPHIGHO2_02_FULL_43_22]|uniref:Pyrroloquinoline quinone-dependent pyranose dehydrogenase beta-propeller domain-containing protein n=1 Tax=Candidatus Yanofskybacteria bacterium RIFCSPHIGHO2_02_FULL_43_22 TaxID=1802681 RepID=A0A1F8FKP4_9BACT|nr:MAG: hypothetical protein A3J47_01300 [Candidatus Yanofskybacteria bacterium RIFCSPHIGHO2_02_FULL_43_22]
MKKVLFGIVLFVSVLVIYLFWSDFGLVKKLISYNASKLKEPEMISTNGKELSFLDIPGGFEASIIAKDLDNPRVILFDPKGRMLVSETKVGRVSIFDSSTVLETNGGFENKRVLVDGLRSPHGLVFFTDLATKITYLYIAETHQVARYPYDINIGKITNKIGQNIVTLPTSSTDRHLTRTIAFGANTRSVDLIGKKVFKGLYDKDKLYISVGSSCDVCVEDSWKRAAILESDPEGTITAEFAGGLRNSVFFTLHPLTGEMWATEMGRDNLGDDLPPDEINIIKPAGPEQKFGARRFGWPFCYGNKVKDETFKPEKIERIDIPTDCSKTDAPVIEIPAHSAPLGLVFIPINFGWPKEWEGDLLVAFHGSWNKSEPTGYKIVRFKVDKTGKVSETADFITGWISENNKKVYGRPVDLKLGPNGALYISDDAAGVIYRIISNF